MTRFDTLVTAKGFQWIMQYIIDAELGLNTTVGNRTELLGFDFNT